MPRSRSLTRLTMRVGLLHLGQSVDFVVSITFWRSPVFAIFAMGWLVLLLGLSLHTRAVGVPSRQFPGLWVDEGRWRLQRRGLGALPGPTETSGSGTRSSQSTSGPSFDWGSRLWQVQRDQFGLVAGGVCGGSAGAGSGSSAGGFVLSAGGGVR